MTTTLTDEQLAEAIQSAKGKLGCLTPTDIAEAAIAKYKEVHQAQQVQGVEAVARQGRSRWGDDGDRWLKWENIEPREVVYWQQEAAHKPERHEVRALYPASAITARDARIAELEEERDVLQTVVKNYAERIATLEAALTVAEEALKVGVREINMLGGAKEAVPLHSALTTLRAAMRAVEVKP